MIKKNIILLLIPFCMFSQDEKLRIETINVFKEYNPKVSNSNKISSQPIFTDTLESVVISKKPILNKNLALSDDQVFTNPVKFRFKNTQHTFSKYASLFLGNHSFLNGKFHYTNGLSVLHNSGFLLEHSSEDYRLKAPHYHRHNGQLDQSFNIYTNRFLDDKLLSAYCNLRKISGLYWGLSEDVPIENVSNYIGSSLNFQTHITEMNKEKIFHSLIVNGNYFFNNYDRAESAIKSAIQLKRASGLRNYSLSLEGELIKTSLESAFTDGYMQNSLNWIPLSILNTNLSTLTTNKSFTDFLFSSEFLASGTQILDYKIGFNTAYGKLNHEDNPSFFIFPSIHILKNIDGNQRFEFLIKKNLLHNSFSNLFNLIPFSDPYFRPSFLRKFETSLTYNTNFSNQLSVFNSVSYSVVNNQLIPVLSVSPIESNSHPLYMHLLDVKGFAFNSSISLNKVNYNILMSAHFNFLKVEEFNSRDLFPKMELSSTIHVSVFNNIDIVSDWFFVSKSESLRVDSVFETVSSYHQISSYVDANLSIKYAFQDMIFSVDFKNLLGQKMDFFDGYYDDDGLKIRLGVFYKF